MINNQPWAARRLNFLASALGARRYLEIGVAEGHTFAQVGVEEKTGVDPMPTLDPAIDEATGSRVVQLTSDDFFATLSPATTFDLVYIDGLHTFEQTYRDLCNVLLHTHVGSTILLDDTVPADVYSAIPDKPRSILQRSRDPNAIASWSGDVYKVVLAVHDFHFGLDYRTIVGSGNPQTLIWRSKSFVRTPSLKSLELISRFSYFDLRENMGLLRTEQEPEALNTCIAAVSSP